MHLAFSAQGERGQNKSAANRRMSQMKLHIGGIEPKEGWKILNVQPGPQVDFVGPCHDLSRFRDKSVDQIYASHVYEHLSHRGEIQQALSEGLRVLKPGGQIMISVPDFELLCQAFQQDQFTQEQRFQILIYIFGAQVDAYDFHKIGLTEEFLTRYLSLAGFANMERVEEFGLFDDASCMKLGTYYLSLNMVATKSLAL